VLLADRVRLLTDCLEERNAALDRIRGSRRDDERLGRGRRYGKPPDRRHHRDHRVERGQAARAAM
jgi:hypothetical protein